MESEREDQVACIRCGSPGALGIPPRCDICRAAFVETAMGGDSPQRSTEVAKYGSMAVLMIFVLLAAGAMGLMLLFALLSHH